ncbi:MAG TPA: aconitate hydratase AcnA [Alphaproteobacteria bacterium]|nr:aconitate hydratase AcnA [Alphaproteobacteria bacterium]
MDRSSFVRDIATPFGPTAVYDIRPAAKALGIDAAKLPYSLRVVAESVLRHMDGVGATESDFARLVKRERDSDQAIPFFVARVILPDSSGLPMLLDFAALRSALERAGKDSSQVKFEVPVDLIVDHSLQVDIAGQGDAMQINMRKEFERNGERYKFVKWAQQAFPGLRVVPPGMGIIHQINLESLASVVVRREQDGKQIAFPDSVLGGDSHTPMINAAGVLGWGVGGIEAECVVTGLPYYLPTPEVVGVRLTGALPVGTTTTDLALLITQRLRQERVVGAFCEFHGPAASRLSLPERATLANMAPEYGATAGFFPIDAVTIAYLKQSGRSDEHVAFVETYAKETGLYRTDEGMDIAYDRLVEIDLASVVPALAGPRRPHDRVALSNAAAQFADLLAKPASDGGFRKDPVPMQSGEYRDGMIAIAAITSCTNTSNPSVMLAAGLLARNAVRAGLTVPAWVKTSLAPGSRVVSSYLSQSGLMEPLEALGFHVIGYGCTTCGGKSGPLKPETAKAIEADDLVAVAVLSSNRNFEGRINRLVRANYIASPPLVIAYALAGRMDIDLTTQPLGRGKDGKPIFLKDIWPTAEEQNALLQSLFTPELFRQNYATLYAGTEEWTQLEAPQGPTFAWNRASTYLVEPPFFDDGVTAVPDGAIKGARTLALFGDSITTDHASPGGEIPVTSEAGKYLLGHGVAREGFNTYVGRRGNHHVMARATFANIRIRNLLVPGSEGGVTLKFPEAQETSLFAATEAYRAEGTPLIVVAGSEYGTGSSRDWAAKGPLLLGVRAILAKSFERIHRSNLIGVGILPIQFLPGEGWQELGLTGHERFDFEGIRLEPRSRLTVTATAPDGTAKRFEAELAVYAAIEAECLKGGGIFMQLRQQYETEAA